MRPEGGPMRRLTTRSGEYATWSPDGTRLAFASARDGDYDLYVIDADGSDEHVIVDAPGYQMYPAWSPDGQWIAYETGPGSIDRLQIHVMHPDGTEDRAITADEATNRFPAWSADGRLAWSASGILTVVDLHGDAPRTIGPGQFPAWRAWSPGAPSC
jgi:Tol biopolymer transport system component